MGVLKGLADLSKHVYSKVFPEWTILLEVAFERHTRSIFHHHIRCATIGRTEVEDSHDVGMVEPGADPSLLLKRYEFFFIQCMQDLYGYPGCYQSIAAKVDLSRDALAQHGQRAVAI